MPLLEDDTGEGKTTTIGKYKVRGQTTWCVIHLVHLLIVQSNNTLKHRIE